MSEAEVTGRGRSRRPFWAPFLLVCAAICAPALGADPAQLLEQVRGTTLDPDGVVELRNVRLPLGDGVLEISNGVLFPTEPIDGRVVEMVFIGQARFRVEPPDAIEAGQLELFTGRRSLDAPVDAAVLVLVDQDKVGGLLVHPAPPELRPELIERAEKLHHDWLNKTERRNTGAEASLYRALLGDAVYRSYFALWCQSYELGDFVYQLDPEDAEALTLGSFEPIDIKGWDRVRLERHIRMQQRKGRWLGVRLQDLGAWDIWMSGGFADAGEQPSGNVGFEADHYELDVKILRNSLRLDGRARLEMTATDSGRRAISLELYRDLLVDSVTDGQGRSLFSFRTGQEIVVVLPEPSQTGQKLTLDIAYSGRALKWVGRKSQDLQNTSSWHPHCGTIDRATYDVTLHWPKSFDLVAGGRRVDGGRNGRYLWERRTLDVPSIAFSFVLGDFETVRRQVGEIELEIAFNARATTRTSDALREEVADTTARALEYFQQVFGPYPLDQLVIATLPRDYSQSYLGFVTLADNVISPVVASTADIEWIRTTTIAHELAHQWWGNMLGWSSYRDQWLSEAMANYSALVFYSRADETREGFLAEMSAGWRDSLSRTTLGGRPVESLGPIVLGGRLNSSEAGAAYRSIIYRKGAAVLAMLARAVGEEQFLEMLGSLVEAAGHRVITTEAFLQAIERMSGLELDGFAQQFIYGTGIPNVYYRYDEADRNEDGWTLRGKANRVAAPHYRQIITRTPAGEWDIARQPRPDSEVDETALVVPFTVKLQAGDETRRAADGTLIRSGRLMLEGRAADFEIHTENRPVELDLDPHGEILARFYSIQRNPKRVAYYRGQDLAADGDWKEAEQAYRQALTQPSGDPDRPALPWMDIADAEVRELDARIRLALCRLFLDRHDHEQGAEQLRAVDLLLEQNQNKLRMERAVLTSRIEIQQGIHAPAYRRLKKTLRLAGDGRQATGRRSLLVQIQLRSERLAMTEAYMLLAVAAYELGHENDARWALEAARERGADVSLLVRTLIG